MQDELEEKILSAFDQGWNKQQPEAMYAFCAERFVHHRPPFPDLEGVDAEMQDISETFKIFSNIRFEIHEIISAKDKVILRWTWQAKHTGQSLSLPRPPSNQDITMDGCSILLFESGKIIEEWEYADYLGFYTQLEMIPPLI